MKNIWKFSLIGSFIVMFDQLLKGAVQFQEQKLEDFLYFGSYKQISTLPTWLMIILLTMVLTYSGYQIVKKRNEQSLKPWFYATVFTGVFTKLFDLVTVGYFLHYINIKGELFFGIAEVMFLIALSLYFTHKLQVKRT